MVRNCGVALPESRRTDHDHRQSLRRTVSKQLPVIPDAIILGDLSQLRYSCLQILQQERFVVSALFGKHHDLLGRAVAASQSRRHWLPYGDAAAVLPDEGWAEFDAYRDAQFYLDQPGVLRRTGGETSPFGFALGVSYPLCSPEALIQAASAALPAWARASPQDRVGVCLEVLALLNERRDELAHALVHTTGSPMSLARLQGVSQALARGLEAVAVAWREMSSFSAAALWERRSTVQGNVQVFKRFSPVPRGVSLVMGCSVAPTWMAFPGLFASLATGNPVVVKPHPSAILPLAITVAVFRKVLKEQGFDPALVSLLVDAADAPVAREAAVHPQVRLIDYTGRPAFAEWLRTHATQADQFIFSSATNCVVVDSTRDYKGLLRYLVGSMAYCSGQLPTSPQNIFVPANGIETPEGRIDVDQFGRDIGFVMARLFDDPERAAEVLGAIRSSETLQGIEMARNRGEVLRDTESIEHPVWPGAHLRTPLLIRCVAADESVFGPEAPGPVNYLVETSTAATALALAERVMLRHGALELQVYSTNANVLQMAEETARRSGVHLASNLTGTLSQVMALISPNPFSDLQGAAGNPASSATLIDTQFVSRRFSWMESQSGDPA